MAVEKQNEKRLFYYQHLNVFLVQTISILNEASLLHIFEYCSCLTRCHVGVGKAVFLPFSLLGHRGEANQIVLPLSLIPHHLRSPSIHILELALVSLYNICLFLNIIHEGEHLLQVNQEITQLTARGNSLIATKVSATCVPFGFCLDFAKVVELWSSWKKNYNINS